MKSPFSFKQYGESGQWVCDKYTNVAKHVDKFAFIKSCYSESNDHVPAIYQINSGLARPGFPTAGAWINYGLGSENQNLPGYVVMGNTKGAKGGPHNWGAGFLPTTYQGTLFRSQGTPVLNLNRQPSIKDRDQRAQLDLMAKLNDEHAKRHDRDAAFANRMQSFELGLSHADGSDGGRRSVEGIEGYANNVWHRQSRVALLRVEVPHGEAIDRKRRSLCASLQ